MAFYVQFKSKTAANFSKLCVFLNISALLLISLVVWSRHVKHNAFDPCNYIPQRADIPLEPKLIHFQWKDEDVPPFQARVLERWKRHFPSPEYTIKLWTDSTIEGLVKSDYPWFEPLFKRLPKPIMRVDASRLLILHRFGGLYSDLDYLPHENFWSRLPNAIPSLIQSPYASAEAFQNSLMSSPPGHAFWLEALAVVVERIMGPSKYPNPEDPNNALWVAGPLAVSEAVARYRQFGGEIAALPCQNFYRAARYRLEAFGIYFDRTGYMVSNKLRQRAISMHIRDCGNPDDSRCLLGTHVSTQLWNFEFVGASLNSQKSAWKEFNISMEDWDAFEGG